MKKIRIFTLALVSALLGLTASGCADTAVLATNDLMADITLSEWNEPVDSAEYISAASDFSVKLLQQSMAGQGENVLVSPTSVYLALTLAAGGAGGNTLNELTALLGGALPMDTINEETAALQGALTKSGALQIANSIWYRDDSSLSVEKDFLEINGRYFGASAYKADFSAPQTLEDINGWVKEKTGGLIDRIIEEIKPETMLYLINALHFEGLWVKPYTKGSVSEGTFTAQGGQAQTVNFMYSEEFIYLEDDGATGFIKPYKEEGFAFFALLPNEGTGVADYVNSLTGEKLQALFANQQAGATVNASMPKFKVEYQASLVEPLKAMGIQDGFDGDQADFTPMATLAGGNLFIGDVIHKTYIEVYEQGTKAGAVTAIAIDTEGMPTDIKTVKLDRPFVYGILDTSTNLPVFIGALTSVE